jgi:LmbE family N-acetylglucosaminyl deacetylase
MSERACTLMFIFAHPDDEAFGTGGSLSKYAAEGHRVYLVTATRGEAGGISDPALASPASLPDVREQELRNACALYGIEPPVFLDYMDGQCTIVHQGQAVGKLVRLLRHLRPEVVVTFGPDGIYGHYDHIAAHRWATIAVRLAADPGCFPDVSGGVCEAHEVSKVYHRVLPQSQVDAMSAGGQPPSVMMDGVPFPMVGYPDEQITTRVDVSAYVDQKVAGIQCHRTQLRSGNPYVAAPEQAKLAPMFREETYRLVLSRVGAAAEPETDLLFGLM